jgi:hypothetical protein
MNLPDIEHYIDMKIPVSAIEPAWLAAPPPRALPQAAHFEHPDTEIPMASTGKPAPGKRRRRHKPKGQVASPAANA